MRKVMLVLAMVPLLGCASGQPDAVGEPTTVSANGELEMEDQPSGSNEPELSIERPLAPIATSTSVVSRPVPMQAPTNLALPTVRSQNLAPGGDFAKNFGSWKLVNASVVGKGSAAKVKLESRGFVQVNIDLGPTVGLDRFRFGAYLSNDVSGSVSFTNDAGDELDRFLLPRVRKPGTITTNDRLPKKAARAVITFTYQPGSKKPGLSGVVDDVVLYTSP